MASGSFYQWDPPASPRRANDINGVEGEQINEDAGAFLLCATRLPRRLIGLLAETAAGISKGSLVRAMIVCGLDEIGGEIDDDLRWAACHIQASQHAGSEVPLGVRAARLLARCGTRVRGDRPSGRPGGAMGCLLDLTCRASAWASFG